MSVGQKILCDIEVLEIKALIHFDQSPLYGSNVTASNTAYVDLARNVKCLILKFPFGANHSVASVIQGKCDGMHFFRQWER